MSQYSDSLTLGNAPVTALYLSRHKGDMENVVRRGDVETLILDGGLPPGKLLTLSPERLAAMSNERKAAFAALGVTLKPYSVVVMHQPYIPSTCEPMEGPFSCDLCGAPTECDCVASVHTTDRPRSL